MTQITAQDLQDDLLKEIKGQRKLNQLRKLTLKKSKKSFDKLIKTDTLTPISLKLQKDVLKIFGEELQQRLQRD
ncbi:hypothetical protein Tco_0925571 [Tanacetum coccineum]|uniref:Uncharacterized protein n=1 Tax=Tanacetum coccineum TaxID=301880 RepID=A0ABQ5D8J6_9ASTR